MSYAVALGINLHPTFVLGHTIEVRSGMEVYWNALVKKCPCLSVALHWYRQALVRMERQSLIADQVGD